MRRRPRASLARECTRPRDGVSRSRAPSDPGALMIASPRWLLACALALSACGAPPPEPPPADTAGGEAAPRERPTGPVQSYVGDGDGVVVRIDMEAVRGSTLAADIGSMLRSYPTWRQLL